MNIQEIFVNAGDITPDMPVVCGTDENAQFAVVDHLEGDQIKLKRDELGHHHYIPLAWAKRLVDGKLQIDRPAKEAIADWTTRPELVQ